MLTTDAPYVGAAWRSRFLRSPKYALILAERNDFVPLGDLADVRLGIKTGCDKFFFLHTDTPTGEDSRLRVGKGKRIAVRGYQGWTGEVMAADLRPAALNPHQLFRSEGVRRFKVSKDTGTLYLFPRAKAPTADLPYYLQLAEHEEIDKKKLVKSNGSPTQWYRQSRSLVVAPWLLPYNSAYDYGAWDNATGAVMNGRFIGVLPHDGIDSDLLGAVLNTTFVIMTRLLVGTSTGVEAAFDVGPPAARRMAIPDIRNFSADGCAEVRKALGALRRSDTMPPAPDDQGAAPSARRNLDIAVLQAMGLTAGEASAVVSRCYASYARWRTAVRSVQKKMEENRQVMNRSGVGRGGDPMKAAAKQVWEEVRAGIPLLPSSALKASDSFDEVPVDQKWRPGSQEPLIDAGRVPVATGKHQDLGSFARARYVGAMLDLGFRSPVHVPADAVRCEAVVTAYESARARVVSEARRAGRAYVGDSSLDELAEAVVVIWARACRTAG